VPRNAGTVTFAILSDLSVSGRLHWLPGSDYVRAFCSVLGIRNVRLTGRSERAVGPAAERPAVLARYPD
jgi:hypothetical protein